MNMGGGVFSNETVYSTTVAPGSLIVDDINNDQHLDILVVDSFKNEVELHLGEANGNFLSEQIIPIRSNPNDIVVATVLNRNNKEMIVIYDNHNVTDVYYNSDMDTFSNYTTFLTGDETFRIQAVDMTNDTKVDLVIAHTTGTIGVLVNNGDDTFTYQTLFNASIIPRDFQVADMNNDGLPDIIYTDYSDGYYILYNRGYGSRPQELWYNVSAKANSLNITDMNNDNRLDIILVHSDNRAIGIEYNQGNERFVYQPIQLELLSLNESTPITRATAFDIDNDRSKELIVMSEKEIIIYSLKCQ